MGVTVKSTHTVIGEPPVIEVTVIGETVQEVLDTLQQVGEGLVGVNWSGKPHKPLQDASRPTPLKEGKEAGEGSAEMLKAQRDKALSHLTRLYGDPRTRAATKGLLAKYGAAKFGEIALEKAASLLKDAEDLLPLLEK